MNFKFMKCILATLEVRISICVSRTVDQGHVPNKKGKKEKNRRERPKIFTVSLSCFMTSPEK